MGRLRTACSVSCRMAVPSQSLMELTITKSGSQRMVPQGRSLRIAQLKGHGALSIGTPLQTDTSGGLAGQQGELRCT